MIQAFNLTLNKVVALILINDYLCININEVKYSEFDK